MLVTRVLVTASAYRGLVLELVVGPVGALPAGRTAHPAASALSLVAWGTGALAAARYAVRSD